MALNQDVIELGSSDEEVPTPKKKRQMPNAMVHIPKRLPGITIKPTNNKIKISPTNKTKASPNTVTVISPTNSKSKINPLSIAKASTIGKGVTVTKVPKNTVSNPFAAKNKVGNEVVLKQLPNKYVQIPVMKTVPIPLHNTQLKALQKPKNTQSQRTVQIPIKLAKGISTSNLKPISSLPPGITVKRTSQLGQPVMKRKMNPNPMSRPAKRKNPPAPNLTEIVELDDDEGAPSGAASGPQWYMRPEEENSKGSNSPQKTEIETDEVPKYSEDKETTEVEISADLEQQNNKEPDTPTFIEITIEDSPAKPLSKRAIEVAEMAITIDDSPVKAAAEKMTHHSGDEESTEKNTEKHSKKKLDYPKTTTETVEIEIELTPVDPVDLNQERTESQDAVEMQIVEIEESPLKPLENPHTRTPKKKSRPQIKVPEIKLIDDIKTVEKPKTPGEFHPIYQSFIDLCFKLENSEDMSKIVDKKIKAYYRQVPKEYTESEAFIDMVGSKISAMRAGPEKMYLYIKDVVDELNLQRKIAKSQPVKLDTVNEEQEKILYGEESEFDIKRQRQIRKLDKTLKKLHRAIQKLEEQEVDFDDEEDSVYLLTESCEEGTSKDIDQPLEKAELLKRYKERMIRVHAKFCQLTNTKMPSEPRVQIDARPGQHKGPAKRLERWINKKVPIGTPMPFPDFHDVLRCVRDANQEDKLGWNEADIMEEARDLFTRCGKKLQRRRQENEWRLAASRIQQEIDPAEDSEDLKKKLEDNRRVASKKENEVLNKYADRQNQLNLEAVEIGDKEADESPVETDDDEPIEEKSSLETKEKRKERLKRLLQKKKKVTDGKVTDEKDSQPDAESENQAEVAEDIEHKDNDSQEETVSKEKEFMSDKLETDPLSDKHLKDPLAKEKDPLSDKHEMNNGRSDPEKIHSLSDDSNKIDSDIDELHLLQKLHSDEINSSSLEYSDSESAIAISDSISSGDNKKQADDVISIENSSYSESEHNKQEHELESSSRKKVTVESINVQMEIETSNAGVEKKINKSNNDEYNESVEHILLASSDDEAKDDQEKCHKQKQSKTGQEVNNDIPDKTCDTTDASSMDSIEITVLKSMNSNETNADSAIEVTSINSNDAVDEEIITKSDEPINATDVTSITSSLEDETETIPIDDIADKAIDDDEVMHDVVISAKVDEKDSNSYSEISCVETVESIDGTVNKTNGSEEASSGIKPTEISSNDGTANADKVVEVNSNEIKSTDAKENKTESSNAEKGSAEDKTTHSDNPIAKEVTIAEVIAKEAKINSNDEEKELGKTDDDDTKVNNGDNDMPAAEQMEVDVMDKT